MAIQAMTISKTKRRVTALMRRAGGVADHGGAHLLSLVMGRQPLASSERSSVFSALHSGHTSSGNISGSSVTSDISPPSQARISVESVAGAGRPHFEQRRSMAQFLHERA